MSHSELIDENIAIAIDLLESINEVNKMIKLHEDDENSLMLDQYKYRRKKFLKEFKAILEAFNIDLGDLAA